MKITIERAALIKALGHVQSVVERRNTIPILSNVLISAEGEHAHFAATDLDMKMEESISAEVAAPGATTAPALTLYEIVRKLPEGSQAVLETSPDGARLTLSAGRSRFALPCLPASDFPVVSADGFAANFELGKAELARLIDKTRFAISTEETRFYLNGIHMHVVDAQTAGSDAPMLRAVATDGARLALADNPLPDGAASMPGVIIPRKTVQEVRRLLDDADDLVRIGVSEAKIKIEFGSATLTSKLIDGAYPDYARVIPKGNDKKLIVDNGDFQKAVDRVATISAERSRAVKLTLGADTLTLTVNNPDAGQATEELSVDFQADPLEIGFNAKFLLDIVAQVEGATTEVRLADAASPALVLDTADAHAKYVLMPLRV